MEYFDYGYAGIVAAGGIMGYAKAASVPSLVAGLCFGGLAGIGAYYKNDVLIAVTSGTLMALMGHRFYNSGKFMPAGLITGLSAIELVNKVVTIMSNK